LKFIINNWLEWKTIFVSSGENEDVASFAVLTVNYYWLMPSAFMMQISLSAFGATVPCLQV
jgi:hypothetical protein